MTAIRAEMSFSPTLRGWSYLLEGKGYITKGQFPQLEARITLARKRGWLDLNVTAEDTTRTVRGLPSLSYPDPGEHLKAYIDAAVTHYMPRGPDEFRAKHVEIQVEKLDLLELFTPAAHDYGVGITCSKGWNDLHSRAAMLRRFDEADPDGGRDGVLLVFGDFDPGGLQITEHLENNLEEASDAINNSPQFTGCFESDSEGGPLTFNGWFPPTIDIERVGLNFEDIEELGLTWIDGLETSGRDSTGKARDLSKPSHPQHYNEHVQDYLSRYGARKCEANALIVRPDAADRIIRAALAEHISDQEVQAWRDAISESRRAISEVADRVLRAL